MTACTIWIASTAESYFPADFTYNWYIPKTVTATTLYSMSVHRISRGFPSYLFHASVSPVSNINLSENISSCIKAKALVIECPQISL